MLCLSVSLECILHAHKSQKCTSDTQYETAALCSVTANWFSTPIEQCVSKKNKLHTFLNVFSIFLVNRHSSAHWAEYMIIRAEVLMKPVMPYRRVLQLKIINCHYEVSARGSKCELGGHLEMGLVSGVNWVNPYGSLYHDIINIALQRHAFISNMFKHCLYSFIPLIFWILIGHWVLINYPLTDNSIFL